MPQPEGREATPASGARPRVVVDLGPLRRSPAYRRLWIGYLVSYVGSQLTVVAVPYQVYRATHSSLQVGLVSLAQLGGLIVGSLAGGVVADHVDRRRLLVSSQILLVCTSVGLMANALGSGGLVAIYLCSAAAAALTGLGSPTRSALVVALVAREDIVTANALWQLLSQISVVVGPALAGILLARIGLASLYGLDAASFLAATLGAARLPRATLESGSGGGLSLGSFADGMRFLRTERLMQAVYLIDLNAMVFGMPRALFPALALGRYHGGASVLGLLYAAPGVGALCIALFTGWTAGIRRQGVAVVCAVGIWGGAIAAFGLVRALWVGLACLAVAGAADVVSAIFRGTILQLEAPDELRGRVQGVQFAVVAGGPRLGDVEAALVAGGFGVETSIVSGGIACLAGVALLLRAIPGLWRYDTGEGRGRDAPAGALLAPELSPGRLAAPLSGADDSVGG